MDGWCDFNNASRSSFGSIKISVNVFLTKNPNLKKNVGFFLGGGGRVLVGGRLE